jgi:hypothetical protein
VTHLLVTNRPNKAGTNELGARATTIVDARMAQAQTKARDNHKINAKVRASLGAMADLNKPTDEVVVVRAAKANGKTVMKVREVAVPKAHQLNSLSLFKLRTTGRLVFVIVHIHFISISCDRLEAKSPWDLLCPAY